MKEIILARAGGIRGQRLGKKNRLRLLLRDDDRFCKNRRIVFSVCIKILIFQKTAEYQKKRLAPSSSNYLFYYFASRGFFHNPSINPEITDPIRTASRNNNA
jgi:hypothetical protein